MEHSGHWRRALRRVGLWGAIALAAGLAACGGGRNGGADDPSAPNAHYRPATREAAARFLTQATFGPTEGEIDRLMAYGYRAWIEDQFAKPISKHRIEWERRNEEIKASQPGRSADQSHVVHHFWKTAVTGQDQLRQRVAYALSQIFVVSMASSSLAEHSRGVAGYLDMLADQGLGNYRQLIESVSRHPMMGFYLSHLGNQKEDARTGRVPDQNYAREVMQLFSIGLHQLNPDGTLRLNGGQPIETYGAEDVLGLSRVFTGFSWSGPDTRDERFHGWPLQYQDPERQWRPMQGYARFHEGQPKAFLGSAVAAQAMPDPEASLARAMDALHRHPNVGPFIGRQLIQRLVSSNPSPAYVARVAAAFNDNGQGVRGDMRAVVRAVLLDPEALDFDKVKDPSFGKLREPVLRLSAFLRAFKASSDSGRFLIDPTDDAGTQLGQTPLRAPSVFNFYRPGYVPPGTRAEAASLVVPEMQITHETSTAGYVNFMRDALVHGVGRWQSGTVTRPDVQLDFSAERALVHQPAALVAHLNRKLAYGQMPEALMSEIRSAVTAIELPPLSADKGNQWAVDRGTRARVQAAVFLTLVSPEFIVQK